MFRVSGNGGMEKKMETTIMVYRDYYKNPFLLSVSLLAIIYSHSLNCLKV